jgi:hypothetical protein
MGAAGATATPQEIAGFRKMPRHHPEELRGINQVSGWYPGRKLAAPAPGRRSTSSARAMMQFFR